MHLETHHTTYRTLFPWDWNSPPKELQGYANAHMMGGVQTHNERIGILNGLFKPNIIKSQIKLYATRVHSQINKLN